jgi:hypothetical protein
MQDVRDSMTSGERGPVSPIKAFLVLGAVVAATIGMIIATRPDPAPPADRPTAKTVPTKAEAIAIFKDLHELWLRSYRERDASLIKLFAAPDAEGNLQLVAKEIAQLRENGVVDRTRYVDESLRVLSASSNEVVVEQTVTVRPSFVDEDSGSDLTADASAQRQRVEWSLRRYAQGWRIFGSEITAATDQP